MIKKTLNATKDATFCVELPNAQKHGMPTPTGTGFFVSPDGWFITAAHVVTKNGSPDGPVRQDLAQAWLKKEQSAGANAPSAICQHITLDCILPEIDLALLKVDLAQNANKHWMNGRSGFPYIQISAKALEDGDSVYAFGYPLSEAISRATPTGIIGSSHLSPRVTSAIVSSTMERTKMVMTSADPKVYVLDKALNYGNSGGPIVSTETGHVHALCSRFQPVAVPQPHLSSPGGQNLYVTIPSLYGIVSSLGNEAAVQLFSSKGVPVLLA